VAALNQSVDQTRDHGLNQADIDPSTDLKVGGDEHPA
jgi:hypothetical protein